MRHLRETQILDGCAIFVDYLMDLDVLFHLQYPELAPGLVCVACDHQTVCVPQILTKQHRISAEEPPTQYYYKDHLLNTTRK